MTSDEFARRITAMTQTLYRVSRTMLASGADREDAVAETIRRRGRSGGAFGTSGTWKPGWSAS